MLQAVGSVGSVEWVGELGSVNKQNYNAKINTRVKLNNSSGALARVNKPPRRAKPKAATLQQPSITQLASAGVEETVIAGKRHTRRTTVAPRHPLFQLSLPRLFFMCPSVVSSTNCSLQ